MNDQQEETTKKNPLVTIIGFTYYLLVRGIGLILLLLIGAGIYLYFRGKPLVETTLLPYLSETVGIPIRAKVTKLQLPYSVELEKLIIGEVDNPLLETSRVELELTPSTLLNKQITIKRLAIDNPQIKLQRNASGKWNFPQQSSQASQSNNASSELPLTIEAIDISNLSLHLNDEMTKQKVEINEFTTSIRTIAADKTASISIKQPASIAWEKTGLEESQSQSLSTTLQADAKLPLNQVLTPTGYAISTTIKDLRLSYPGISLPTTNLTTNTKLKSRSGELTLTEMKVQEINDLYSVSFKGALPVSKVMDSTGIVNVNTDKLNLESYSAPGFSAQQGLLTTSLKLDLLEKQIQGNVSLVNFSGSVANATIATPLNLNTELDASLKGKTIILGNNKITLSGESDSKIIDSLVASGTIATTNTNVNKSTLSIHAVSIDVDALQAAYSPQSAKASDQASTPSSNPTLPYYDISFSSDKIKANSLTVNSINLPIKTKDSTISTDGAALKIGTSKINAQGNMNLAGEQVFSADVTSKAIESKDIHALLSPEAERFSEGALQNLSIKASGNLTNLNKSLLAKLSFNFEEVLLPNELQTVIPFSIIAIPFHVLGSIGDIIPSQLLPEAIVNSANAVSSGFRKQQQFGISDGTFSAAVENEVITISEMEFGTTVLPGVYYSGTVGFDGSIEIESGISILDVRVPLPITGTLTTPYPDVQAFAKSLITQFGVSVAKMPLNLLNRVEGATWGTLKKQLNKGKENAQEEDITSEKQTTSSKAEAAENSLSNGKDNQPLP